MTRKFSRMRILSVLILTVIFCGSVFADGKIVAGTNNIAAKATGGHVVDVSDQAVDANGHVMEHWGADNAIDGLHVKGNHTPPNSYGWSTNTPPSEENPHWIVLAFDKPAKTHLISRIVIDPVTDNPSVIGRWVRKIQVQVSVTNPDGPYRTVSRHLVGNRAIKQAFDFAPHECRYLRLVINSNHGSDKCVELGEIEVYEAIIGDDYLDRLIIRLENVLNDLKQYRDGRHYQKKRENLKQVTSKKQAGAGEKQSKKRSKAGQQKAAEKDAKSADKDTEQKKQPQ